MKYQNKNNQVLQTIICSLILPIGFLSCKGKAGKAGTTPAVLIAGVECTRSGSDMRVVIANAFDVNAQFAEYTNQELAKSTQWPAIFCTSGNQIWSNQSPIIAAAHSATIASLSCASIAPNSDDTNIVGCNIEVGQPIQCVAGPSMPGLSAANLSAVNISTVFCVDDISAVTGMNIEEVLSGFNDCAQGGGPNYLFMFGATGPVFGARGNSNCGNSNAN